MIRERAPAKVNLLLHVGARRDDGLHELCSIFAPLDLADELAIEPLSGGDDVIECPSVEGPNIVAAGLGALRERLDGVPPLRVSIDKRIPVAAGLGGGSADAAAVLRAANALAPRPLDRTRLLDVAAAVGSDVPSQLDPRPALVSGAGEAVEPLALPPLALLVLPDEGLSTASVYAEADRLASTRESLDVDAVRQLAAAPLPRFAAGLENDLEPAALSLRPELAGRVAALRAAGALAALVTGSGPSVVGVFEDRPAAEGAAAALPPAHAAIVSAP